MKRDYWAIREEIRKAAITMDGDRIKALKKEYPDVYQNVWNQMKRWERKQGIKWK